MVSSMKGCWLKLGVTILNLGHGLPPGCCGRICVEEIVHGHPVFPYGGGGNSFISGHRMGFYLVEPSVDQAFLVNVQLFVFINTADRYFSGLCLLFLYNAFNNQGIEFCGLVIEQGYTIQLSHPIPFADSKFLEFQGLFLAQSRKHFVR